jgi:hypothetical protein
VVYSGAQGFDPKDPTRRWIDRYNLVVLSKSDGKEVTELAFPGGKNAPPYEMKDTADAGVIKKLDNGIEVFGTVFEFTDDGKVIRKDAKEEEESSVICSIAPADMVFRSPEPGEREDYEFIPIDPLAESRPKCPGFYVYSAKHDKYLRIGKVTTKGGTFGRTPTSEECEAAGKPFPSVRWDFSRLAKQDYAELPLHLSAPIGFPDKIERDEDAGEFILHFGSKWGIEGVGTILKFKVSDLAKAFEDATSKASGKEYVPRDE